MKVTRAQFWTYAAGTLVVLVGLAITYQFVEPEPPDRLVMATGAAEGAYAAYGERYREILGTQGIELVLRPTAGSVENLALLGDGSTGVKVAIVQGGLAPQTEPDAALLSLGGLFLEPLWGFTRLDPAPSRLTELRGRRLAVGLEGSGTRALTMELLAASGVGPADAVILPLGGAAAAQALTAGEADVAFFVNAFATPLIRELAEAEGVELMGFAQSAAYAQVFRSIERVVLHEGAIDFGRPRPTTDKPLVAATANLVIRSDLHPALIDLLLIAAKEVHSDGDIFSPPGHFPSPYTTSFPMAEPAERFYERGPPFLLRYMPFWAASFIDRTSILLIPLLTLLLPLIRIVPPILQWRMESRVYRWYRRLAAIESVVGAGTPAAVARAEVELERLDRDISRIEVPEAYQYLVYRLRSHLDLVRNRVQELSRGQGARPKLAPSRVDE